MKGNEHFPAVTSCPIYPTSGKFKILTFLFLILLSLSSNPLFAVTVKNDEPSGENKARQETPPVTTVVSAARREIPIEKATRVVTVIRREEIERSGKAHVIDLLRALPGVSVTQSGPAGRISSVNLRGTNPNMTLVMLDNVQINSPTTGEANLQYLSTVNIERVEIVRGPQSVLYGADAMGGVINIITKPDRGRGLHADGNFEYGTYRTFDETGSVYGGNDRFSFSGGGGRFDSRGPADNDQNENTTAQIHTKLKVTDNSDLDAAFHYFNALTGLDDGTFLVDPNRYTKNRQQVFNTRYTISLAEWCQQHIQYAFFHDDQRDSDPRNPGAGGADPESRFTLLTDRHTLEYQSNFFIRDFDVITLGYEFEHTDSNVKRSQASGGFERLARNHGWFGQNELILWKLWTIVAGIRVDHYDFYGTQANPLFSSGLWMAKTRTKLKGSFGRAIKAPTFNELFFPGFGNVNLQAEKNWGWDIGFEQLYGKDRGSFSAAFFHNKIDNLIQFVRSGGSTKAENVARALTEGVELEHKIEIFKDLNFYTNYTYTNALDRTTRKRLLRRPWHQGKIGLTYDWKKFHFVSDWIWLGDREETSTGPRTKNDAYMRLDLALFYDLTRFLQVYGRIENVTDDQYYETLGFENPGARFIAGTKGSF